MRVFYFLSIFSLVGCAARLDDVDDRLSDIQKRTSLLEQKSGMPVGSDRELLDNQRLADTRTQVAALRNEVTVLAGRLESLEYENKNLTALVKEMSSKQASQERESKKVAAAAEPIETGPEADYHAAMKAFQDGEFDKAEGLFAGYLKKNPKGDLADNSLFWIGECYKERKMCKNAITKYQDLIERFPKSDMRCEAMRNQIACLKDLGMEKEAAAFSKVRIAECPKE